MAKLQWIVKRSEDGQLFAASVKRKGRVFQCSSVKNLQDGQELGGDVHLALESGNAAVLVEEFPEVSDDILDLQIQNKLDQLALFNMGEVVSTAYTRLEKRRQKQLLSIIAQPEHLTEEGVAAVTAGTSVDIKSCVPAVAAIAALLKQLNPEPYIVLQITPLSAYLMGVRNGIPLFLQSVPLSGTAEVESGVAAHAIGFGRQTLQRDFEIDSCKLVCLGEGRDSFDFEGLDEENWIPDWNHCLAAEGNDIVRYPALFGSLFIDSSFSLLSSEYIRAGQLKKLASIITMSAGFACIALAGLAYYNMDHLKPLQQRLDSERRQLSRKAGEVRRITPDPDIVERVKAYMDIMDKVAIEPSIAMVLRDIARALPDKVLADDLSIIREAGSTAVDDDPMMAVPPPGMEAMPEEPEMSDAGSPAERMLSQQIVVSLTCSSKGEYSLVKARFDKTIKGLAAHFTLRNMDWDYSEKDNAGTFHGELLLEGGAL